MLCDNCKNIMRSHKDMQRLLIERLDQHGSLKELAAKLHLSAAYISDMKQGNRSLTPRVLKELGYVRMEVFVPIDQ